MFYFLWLIVISYLTKGSGEEFCSVDKVSCTKPVTTSVTPNPILLKINKALESYEDCSFNNCSCFLTTLNSDLNYFNKGITASDIKSVRKKGTLYQIVNGEVYRDKECMFPARCAGVEYFLLKLKNKVPNTEFVLNTRDWPQVSKQFGDIGPVFSFSKTENYADIMFPAWSFWEGGPAIKLYPTGLGRWDQHRKMLLKKSEEYTWDKKESKGFFRGSRTSSERDALVLLSRTQPDLVDAQYTKNQAWKSKQDTLDAEPAAEVPLEDHCKYKYLFNFRGVAASFRFKHLFLCGSLVIHVGDEWLEFFYPSMKPWVHYVPLSSQASQTDITNLLEFVREHDDIAQQIAERGKQFVKDHLRLKDVTCYWSQLLNKYSKLLKYKVELDGSLVHIRPKI